MLELKHPVSVYGKYSMRERVERLIQHEVKPNAVFAWRHPLNAVFFIHTSIGGVLTATSILKIINLKMK